MSMNHFTQELPETVWWANSQTPHHHHHQHRQQQPFMDIPSSSPSKPRHHQFSTAPWAFHRGHNASALNFNLNREDDDDLDEQVINGGGGGGGGCGVVGQERRVLSELDNKEVLFEKPLTPSDVGKLNRLVIPKQHAEKYFPLGGESVDKGLLLSFEDESGKFWRFRYSYWSSSQSYVLTKGWSRYVKEKRLDAGDVVFFERHRTNGERIFIRWRRRGEVAAQESGVAPGGDGWRTRRVLYSDSEHHQHHQHQHHHTDFGYPTHQGDDGPPVPYRPDCTHEESDGRRSGNSKGLLRLFGVNMEYQVDDPEPSTSDGSSLSPCRHHPSQHQQFLL